MDVLIISTKNGDWEGMYIDGKLISQGHRLGSGNSFYFLLEMAEKYGFTRSEIRKSELNNEDDEILHDSGSLPEYIGSLKGCY